MPSTKQKIWIPADLTIEEFKILQPAVLLLRRLLDVETSKHAAVWGGNCQPHSDLVEN